MRPGPGEVWLADLGIAGKMRPVIIVSRSDEDPPRDLVVYVPCTSQNSRYEVDVSELPFMRSEGVANVQGMASIPRRRLERKLGTVPDKLLEKIREALRFALDLS
jgi:mRNA interferase MazF